MASLATIKPGDIVKVDRMGRVFYALVTGKEPRRLNIQSLEGQRVTYTNAKSTEVLEHWRKTKNVKRAGRSTGHDAD